MARKKRKSKKQSKKWFGFGSSTSTRRKKPKAGTAETSRRWRAVFTGLMFVCVLGAVAVGLALLDRHIRATSDAGAEVGPLVLVDKPYWFTGELVRKVQAAAGGAEFVLDETAAKTVGQNLQLLPWLYEVKAQTTGDSIQVSARYRQPVGLIRQSGKMYYIDEDLVVLDYVPVSGPVVVEIQGFSSRPPNTGQRWEADDVAAAVQLLIVLGRMDEISTPEAPLLNEISSVDVRNFDGRRSSSRPHIILHAKDGTQVNWGAAYGRSAQYLEATEKEKIAMLYEFYEQHGTIQGIVKYIELRNPQETIPRPTAQ